MNLVERYLQAVRAALPKAQRDDVARELGDNILSQIEDQERALGRAVNEDEQVAVLKKLGHPMALAARYRKPQYVIGPEMYPLYVGTLKVALAISVAVQFIGVVAIAAAGLSLRAILAPVAQLPLIAISVFGWVTLGFAAIDIVFRQRAQQQPWDPRKLPRVPIVVSGRPRSRAELLTAAALAAAIMVWWLASLFHPYLIFGPGAAFVTFGPIWVEIIPLLVLLGLLEVMRPFIEIAAPTSPTPLVLWRVTKWCAILVALYFLIRAEALFVPAHADAIPARFGAVLSGVNAWLRVLMMVAGAITVLQVAWELVKLVAPFTMVR